MWGDSSHLGFKNCLKQAILNIKFIQMCLEADASVKTVICRRSENKP